MKQEILFLVCQQNIFSSPHMATPMKNSGAAPVWESESSAVTIGW